MTEDRGQGAEVLSRLRRAVNQYVPHGGTQTSVLCLLMKLLAIRLGWQTTPAKSLVMSFAF
ncbi:MAG: hypothetical protein Q7S46_04325 [Gallionella sp.]|nr:hypothetical protein [Gallionella sp.]